MYVTRSWVSRLISSALPPGRSNGLHSESAPARAGAEHLDGSVLLALEDQEPQGATEAADGSGGAPGRKPAPGRRS
jgi:hypothetical protein